VHDADQVACSWQHWRVKTLLMFAAVAAECCVEVDCRGQLHDSNGAAMKEAETDNTCLQQPPLP
jgi:hypothetical protein